MATSTNARLRLFILHSHIIGTALLLAFVITLYCASPAYCLETKNNSKKVVLKLWGSMGAIPQKDDASPWGRSTRKVFEAFIKEHPDIEIVNTSGLEIHGLARESNFLMAMAGGAAPDVFYVNFRQLHSYLEQNFLAPLDEFIKEDPAIMSRVHPVIRDVITVDGHVYCIPWFQCVKALYYRKDLFREAGLDPARPPQNWDEFYEYAKKLTVPEKGQWGFFFPQLNGSWYLTDLIWQAGGEVIERDKNGKYRAVFDSKEAAMALAYYKKMTRDPWTRDGKTYRGVAKVTNNGWEDIGRGKIAMWYSYSFELVTTATDLNPSILGIAPLPAGPTGIRANEINAGMWGMNSQIKDPRVKRAAWEYIKFMTGPKADEIRTRSYVENGLWKYVNPEKLIKYGYKEYLKEIPKSWIEANVNAFKYGRPEPNGPGLQMIYNEIDIPMQAIYQNPEADPQALMRKAVNRVNAKLLGYTPPAEMRRNKIIAWIIVIAGLGLFATIVTKQITALVRSGSESQSNTRTMQGSWKYHVVPWIFMLPAVLSILIWMYYPLLRGMLMAFQDYKIIGGSTFVGLDNFIKLIGTDTFWNGLKMSIKYVVLSLGLGFFVPIFLAIMLAEVPMGKMFFRTMYYLPAITSGLVIMFLWKWFYDPSPQGLFNTLLGYVGIGSCEWLNDERLAMICLIIPTIWAGAGPASIIYLAALKSIPEEMYEAADVDGAGIWIKIRHVVFPMLKPLIIINFVGAFIGAFKATENIFVMTGGGPNQATHVLGLDIWFNAFIYLKFGFATAEAWIMGSLLIGFTMYQLRILRDLKFSAGAGQ